LGHLTSKCSQPKQEELGRAEIVHFAVEESQGVEVTDLRRHELDWISPIADSKLVIGFVDQMGSLLRFF
jgi:hypothetical protein